MVQMMENWAQVEGETRSVDDKDERFVTVRLAVDRIADVPGFANLFNEAPGAEVAIDVPRELASRLDVAPGRRLSLQVRRGGPQLFAHPERGRKLD
jgi:hypothetical protein